MIELKMKYPYEEKLKNEAEKFLAIVRDSGYSGRIIPDSYREYSVKVAVSKYQDFIGYIPIYYSPKRNAFSINFQELRDGNCVSLLENCWQSRGNPKRTEWGAYVDGSYINRKVGYGVVLIKKKKLEHEWYGDVTTEFRHSRQVGGELYAVQKVVEWCQKENISEITIYFDYLGVQKWATGEWRTNLLLTSNYAEFIRNSGIRIYWRKVKSHSGNHWNQRADELAKKGASIS